MPTSDNPSVFPLNGAGQAVLDANAAPRLADTLLRCTGGSPLMIAGAARSFAGGVVRVTGTTSLLGVAGAATDLRATLGADGAVTALVVRFTLIEGEGTIGANWIFSRSFADLPPKAKVALANGGDAQPVRRLDTLPLRDAAFVLSDTDGALDPVTNNPLVAGLNFSARLRQTGALGLLETVLGGTDPLPIYGPVLIPLPTETQAPAPVGLVLPWRLDPKPAGVYLKIDLGVDHSFGSLRVHDAAGRVFSPTTQTWMDANPDYAPQYSAELTLDIASAGMSGTIVALDVSSPSALSLFGLFKGVTLGGLAHLADLTGPSDLAAVLPDDVKNAVATLELEALSLSIGPGFTVTSAGVSVGYPNLQTSILTGFTVESLTASFIVADPFGSANLDAVLSGSFNFLDVDFEVSIVIPKGIGYAQLNSGVTLPLSKLFTAVSLPAPPDLTIDALQLEISKDGSYTAFVGMAAGGWTLDLGPTTLTVEDVAAMVSRTAAGSSGSLSGFLKLGDDLTLGLSYATPGAFRAQGELPDVRLLQLVSHLTDLPLTLPGDFDLSLTDTVFLIQGDPGNLVFQLATTAADIGTFAFEAKRSGSGWGFAAGLSLAGSSLSTLSGLGGLTIFEDMFQLSGLTLVVSSFDDPGFQLPALADFNSPVLNAGGRTLPAAAGGVIAGLNVHGTWTLDGSQQQGLLKTLLGLDPTLGITLQIGDQPNRNSRLYVEYDTHIDGHPLSCKLGGQIKNSELGIFLEGTFTAAIQGTDHAFAVTLLFVENGAFISGSMLGTVDFDVLGVSFTLADLVLVIGVDWEGIPSLGVACTLQIDDLNSSLAVFFDSADPSRSLVAGSVSDLSLLDVLTQIAQVPSPPAQLSDLLPVVTLVGTDAFTVADLGFPAALNNLNYAAIQTAFAGHATLGASSSDQLIVKGSDGASWFLTDMKTMTHYELDVQSSGVRVRKNPQIYVVPQDTALGLLTFKQGILINSGLKFLVFQADVEIMARPTEGVLIEGSLNKIVLGTENLFSIESKDGGTGPILSACTFTRSDQTDDRLKGPHFLLDCRINLLSFKREAYILVSSSGMTATIDGDVCPGVSCSLNVRIASYNDFSAEGTVHAGIGSLDLGPLGTVNIDTGADLDMTIGMNSSDAFAKLTGGFEFAGETINLPDIDLDVNTGSLLDLPEELVEKAIEALKDFLLGDAAKWAGWVKDQIITGVEDVAGVLKDVFNKTEDEIKAILGIIDEVEEEVEQDTGCPIKSALGSL